MEILLSKVKRSFESDLNKFERWKRTRVVVDDAVIGGEPTFKGKRLSVRKIGAMVEAGLEDEVREDYPYLEDQDIRFAAIYAKAYPRRGRPREAAHRRESIAEGSSVAS